MAQQLTRDALEQQVSELSQQLESSKQRERALIESERYYRAFFSQGFDGVVVLDPETTRPIDFNDQACRQLGYSRDEFAQLRLSDIEAKETAAEIRTHIQTIVKKGFDTFETFQRTKKGEVRHVHVSAQMIDLGDRHVYHCIWRDITERKIIKAKLKDSLSLLEATLESTADGILVVDGHGRIVRCNAKFVKMWKIPAKILDSRDDDQALNFFTAQLTHPEAFLEKVRELYRFPERSSFDVLAFIDGRIFERYSQPQKIGDVVVGRVWSFRDITESRHAEHALRESEKKYRLIAENTADLISILDMNLKFTYVSPASIRLRGFTVEEAMAQTLEQVLTPESMQSAVSVFEEEMLLEASGTADPDRTRTMELEQYTKDGATVWMEVSFKFLRDQDGNPVEILAVTRDISERKLAERELRESEEKFRLTYDSSPDAVNINRLEDGLFVDINDGFTRATGYTREDVAGRTSLEINLWHDPADRQKLAQGLKEKGYYENLEAQFRRKDGSLITGLMSARLISLKGVPHIISITRDITQNKLLATKLQQAQKFKALGTLAGGIAHDFNNLLMGIQGRASIISMDLDASHPHQDQIKAIEEYIRSATNLTQQLLGLARGGKYEIQPVDINELIHHSAAMFGRTKKEIRIHTKFQASPLVVEVDRRQIEQVLLNMYINAWQAMPQKGGELYLATKIVTVDKAFCKTHEAKPGPYVEVSVTDTGIGMHESIRMQIFDPFFTTKEKGRGTGLGLASAYGVIKNHGGVITVRSEVGHGTTFSIYLPLSDKKPRREVALEEKLLKGSATILLIDDEALIIDVAQAMLERLGYRVETCMGGQEAIELIKNKGHTIDLVILDMILPGMDGGSIFDGIREIHPAMPVLLSSGYAINGQAEKILRKGCNGFIQKPFSIAELSQKVRHVLAESDGSTQAR